MSMHRPVSLTTTPSPPFRPNSPDPLADQGSRLHQRLATIRSFIAREQLLFGNARVNRVAVEQRVDELRQHDEEDAKRVAADDNQHTYCSKSDSDKPSPSAEATKLAVTNENGFSDGSQPLGWFNHMQTQGGKSSAQTRKSQLYESLGAAAQARITAADWTLRKQ